MYEQSAIYEEEGAELLKDAGIKGANDYAAGTNRSHGSRNSKKKQAKLKDSRPGRV